MQLEVTLRSDATFGRGDGVVGLVDSEIEHDVATGLPIIRGRTLKGLLVEACADIFYALSLTGGAPDALANSAAYLFGRPGSRPEDAAHMHIGPAQLPALLREAVATDVTAKRLTTATVLQSLTAIRRQTAVNDETGRPEDGSLRAERVLLRGTTLVARLSFSDDAATHLPLLAAAVRGVQRGGNGRNRGRGRVHLRLLDDEGIDVTERYLAQFATLLGVSNANR